jgi:FkbM family methyltransferase
MAMTFWTGRKDVDWLFGTLLRDSEQTIVLSSPHRDRLSRHHADVKEKTVILPPPPLIRVCQDLPQAVRTRIRTHIGAAEDDFVLVYWGYIYPGKGVETLLRAFRLVCRNDTKMRLILVGGKLEITDRRQSCVDYYEMVRKLPEELGIAERVTWTGHFNWDDDIGSQYLYGGDACVLPFDYGVTLNNSSLAAASAHGLPVISTELAKGRDEALEHGTNIYLCRPRDPELLAEAIQLVRENDTLRDRLRTGALGLARDWYSWDTASKRLVRVLESVVSVSSDIATARTEERSPASNTLLSSMGLPPYNGKGKLSEEQPGSPSFTSPSLPPSDGDLTAPCVSVVVAVHNVDRYLSQCLDALANQTLRNIEIIVVNDASSDRCAEIINSYKLAYPSIKVITCASNKGLATVRNIGLRAATGEYVAFADGDDWVDVKMCEVLYQHAKDTHAEVVIADATVFYEDTKHFGEFFDRHIRQSLDQRLRTTTFGLHSEPSVLLLEPVAWPKLYERNFLRKHAIQFEDGMNSYEDMCFHFSVLLKAKRISLTDDKLFFYRQNRPGQISGRTSRKIFEVFAVFNRIHENLTAWNVDPSIWGILVKVQVRQFNWLLKDRVHSHHKREFLALAAKQLRAIPARGLQSFIHQASEYESATVLCMRRNWLCAYEKVSRNYWPWLSALSLLQRDRLASVAKQLLQLYWEKLYGRVVSIVKPVISKVLVERFDKAFRTVDQKLDRVIHSQVPVLLRGEPLVEVSRFDGQVFHFARPANASLGDALWRVSNDFYLLHTAVLRHGDTVIDVGAHVGVVSIYLAKKYPFIKVYALEPNPLTFACLRRNIELNGVANVIALNKALSGDGQSRTLYTNAWDSGWATLDAKMASSPHLFSTVQIDTVTLEHLFQEYQVGHCRLLKITAPGAVQESLRGFTRTGSVDLLCGEVDFLDCSRVQLEMLSWRIARQHFWRTISHQAKNTVHHFIHKPPTRIEQARGRIVSTLAQREHSLIDSEKS